MTTGANHEASLPLAVGNRCLLALMGQRFLVRVCELSETTVRVSFPSRDFPIEGMQVELEIHDDDGYHVMLTEVVETPRGTSEGLLLQRPRQCRKNRHRSYWRFVVDIKAEIKPHVHPRSYPASLVDLGEGGALLRCGAPVEMEEIVDITFTLPDGDAVTLTARALHQPESEEAVPENVPVLGFMFVNPDPGGVKRILDVARSARRA